MASFFKRFCQFISFVKVLKRNKRYGYFKHLVHIYLTMKLDFNKENEHKNVAATQSLINVKL